MKISISKFNLMLMFKLPAAYFTGVRVTYFDDEKCDVSVKYRWINQNPFNSMFWAVQGMAAELTTGALVMKKIKESGENISMLLLNTNASFTKKATGRISFTCLEGALIDEAIANAHKTGEIQSFWLNSKGLNSDSVEVSSFNFKWTIKIKQN